MKKKKHGLRKRILSISLAAALVVTSLQITVSPTAVKEAEAASTDATMETNTLLDERFIEDPEVLRFYKILANAQRQGKAEELSGKAAGDILAAYTSEEYTRDVYGIHLTEFKGKINFSGLRISNVKGIGWARAATEIDLSGAVFAAPLTEVPAHEFAACKGLEKIILPDSVNKISNNAFESCLKLKTLMIGSGTDDVVDLTKVDEIGASAFSSCTSIEQVDFAEYGTRAAELKIGEYAFASCGQISEITIPIKTAGNLGANAFENCERLQSAGLQNELAYLSNALFKGAGVKAGGLSLYIIGKEQENVSRLPEQIEYIGNHCFDGAYLMCMDLRSCTKLKSIHQYAFAGASWLGSIANEQGAIASSELMLPQSLEEIETLAFNRAGLLAIEIPENCTDIGESAFYKSYLVEIALPKTLKEIKDGTFSECEDLDGGRIQIGAGSELQTIGKEAFSKCKRLNTTGFLKDLQNLTAIGESAFANCYEIEKIDNNEQLNLYGDKRVVAGLREIVLPDCVKTLGDSVFADCYALRTADLGTGVVAIPDKAFYNSLTTANKSGAGLEKVIVSGDLDSIGAEAFANQSRLRTIGYRDAAKTTVEEGVAQFKDGLLSIGDKAFSGCGIQSGFNAGGALAYVKKGALKDSYGPGLSKFLVYDYQNVGKEDNYCRVAYLDEADIVSVSQLIEEGAYDSKSQALTEKGGKEYERVDIVAKEVYVDKKACSKFPNLLNGNEVLEVYDTYDTETEAYKNRFFNVINGMERWYFSKKAEDLVNVSSNEPGAGLTPVWTKLVSSTGLPKVAVKNVQTRSYSINYVFGLHDVILPDTVINDNLGEGAFQNCIDLNEVTLSKNLTEIKANTFAGAGREVVNAINTSNEAKYNDYYGLRKITIPDGVKVIGNNAFDSCFNLLLEKKGGSSFGTSVESIGDNAFQKCYSLDGVWFPTSLKTIGKEAFAGCSIQELKQREVTNEKTNEKYSFWCNQEEYGTKGEKKRGLNVIDFTAATKLESIGAGAFKQTNVDVVNLTDSPLVNISDNLFNQCTFLKTISFQDKTESLGSNVLKDTINLTSVTLPASATMKKDTISGAFGPRVLASDPTITFSYDTVHPIVLPIGSSLRLPINAVNKDNLNGDVKIMADTGNEVYKNIIGQENAYKGMYAEFNTSDDPFSFVLYGTEYVSEPVTVQVEVSTYHQPAASEGATISPHTMKFQVKVQERPTESIALSAAEDGYVKANPAMYEDKGANKILYIPFGKDASTKGVTLTASIDPKESTNDVQWSSDNPAVTISNETYEKGSGVATALIQGAEIGDATVTVKSGEKTDKIHVYSVIPVVNNGITCATSGTFLDTNLKANSSGSPYGLSIGDSDQFAIKMNYGDTDYTDEQIASYGESWQFASSDETVLSVNEDGTFKALAEGDATITVTAKGTGAKLQYYFTVTDSFSYTPTSVQIDGDAVVVDEKNVKKVTMNIGDMVPLSAKVAPTRASQDVTWQVTRGQEVVSVDENGVVTGLKRGSAAVIAISKEKDSVKSDEITFDVLAPATGLRILGGDFTLEIGKEMSISKTTNESAAKGYFVSPVDTTDTISWSSSNEGVLTVTKSNTQSVTVKAVAPGTAVLTGVASSGISGSVTVTVPAKKVSVSGITIDKEVSLNVGGTHQLRPQIQPADANEEVTYTYTTSNDKVATVSASGVITAVGPGSASITAKTNTGRSATCVVTVKSPAKKVTLLAKNKPTAKKIYMAKGQTVTLKSAVTPDNSTDTLTYKSNKAKIAAVTTSGVITAKKKGTAKITVTSTSKKKATITVIVQKKAISAKKVTAKAPKTMKRGKKSRVTVALKPAKSTDSISFSSSNSAVATVDECGYVTAQKKGTVKITVSAASGKKVTKKIKIK